MKSDIMPFNMYGNVYFVGSSRVSVHIIKTEVGLVMIDTGYPVMYEQILDSMEMMGLDPKDICAIFHSHGHLDHFGSTQKFKELSGAKTYISRIDNDIVNGTYDLSWAKELGLPHVEPFNCDVLVEDGDVFTFGSTKIRCRLAPGHTEGTLAIFVHIKENNGEVVAAMHGGIGRNSMEAKWLKEYGLSLDIRQTFLKGLRDLSSEKVDFVLGNHPNQSDTLGKLEKVQKGESILNSEEWPEFLKRVEQRVLEMLEKEQREGIA